MASINDWANNNSYSIATSAKLPNIITIDHWYGNGASLSGACSYVTIGF